MMRARGGSWLHVLPPLFPCAVSVSKETEAEPARRPPHPPSSLKGVSLLRSSCLGMCFGRKRPGECGQASSFSFFAVINFALSFSTERSNPAFLPDRNCSEKQMAVEINTIMELGKRVCSRPGASSPRSHSYSSDVGQPAPRGRRRVNRLAGAGGLISIYLS